MNHAEVVVEKLQNTHYVHNADKRYKKSVSGIGVGHLNRCIVPAFVRWKKIR